MTYIKRISQFISVDDLRTTVQSARFWLIIWLVLSSVIGLFTFRQFGISWDEHYIYTYASQARQAYAGIFTPGYKQVYIYNLQYYGPFYFMLVDVLVSGLRGLGISIPAMDLWHLAYFLTFQVGVIFVYLLSQRWLDEWPALGVTLLFASQPLFWGHAFINPKDIPFMVFFLASIYTGLRMVDYLQATLPAATMPQLTIKTPDHQEKQNAIRGVATFLGLAVFFALATPLWNTLLASALKYIYSANEQDFLGNFLRKVINLSTDIPIQSYIAKATTWLNWFETALVVSLCMISLWIFLHKLLGVTAQLKAWLVQVFVTQPSRDFFFVLKARPVLIAGIVLGSTLAIRLGGLLAGVLIALLVFWKLRERSITILCIYAFLAMICMYIFWPFLWENPIKNFLESVQVMSDFAALGNWTSLPTLLAIQFTEPVIILVVLGLFALLMSLKQAKRSEFLSVLLIWSIFPLSALILEQKDLYDNFRQIMFVIPPLFILAGFGLQVIFQYLKPSILRVLTILLIVFLGWNAIFQLHPYEYVYYNRFSEVIPGHLKNFEGEYWGTSLRSVAKFLNQFAPSKAQIALCGPKDVLQLDLRDDLLIESTCNLRDAKKSGYAYYVVHFRNLNSKAPKNQSVVYSVGRQDQIFSFVLSLK